MPAMLVEQQRPDDAARALLHRPIELARLPRLAGALDGLFAALADASVDATAFTGAASPAALVAARPTVAAIYAHTLFGSGLPLVGAYPHERALLLEELSLRDPDALLDLRLSGNLVHELCHGPADGRALPWMIAEAAALHLGARARPAHVFPDEPGEAVPGVSLFVCFAEGLARRFGARALVRLCAGAPLAEVLGERTARALTAAAWQDWQARQEPPFARDALSAMAWIKLAEAPPPIDDVLDGDLLARAARVPWRELPSWRDPPRDEDGTAARVAVSALFQVNRLAPTFQTWPSEPPNGRLLLDVEACTLAAAPRPDGVFAEPAWWLFPPSLCRRLWERGARRVRVEGARRERRVAIAEALVALARDGGALREETVLCEEPAWTSSR
jgi:hypothetical protein